SGDPPGGLGARDRFAADQIQRHLHRDGYGPRRAGTPARSLYVELQRGAAVRAEAGAPHRPAPRLESARDDPELDGPPLQTPRAAAAAGPSAPADDSNTGPLIARPVGADT